MVSVSCFGVRISVLFHFMFVHYTYTGLLSGHLLGIAARSVSNLFNCILSICNIHLFPVLVLRAGFGLLIAPVLVNCFSIS